MDRIGQIRGYLEKYGDTTNFARCVDLLEKESFLFLQSPGSSHNHQAWPGGYLDHIGDVLAIAETLYTNVAGFPFKLSDAILVLFLHDLEKPWKYVEGVSFKDDAHKHAFRLEKIGEYGIQLDEDCLTALKYVEGEHADYSNTKRAMNPLAAFCHMCDVASARIWHGM